EHYSDGYTLYHFAAGAIVVQPDNTQFFCPRLVFYSEIPFGTPPPLPTDPARGTRWVEHHNDQLLQIIGTQVSQDVATLNAIKADEAASTGGDLFRQTDYLTGLAAFYAGHGP